MRLPRVRFTVRRLILTLAVGALFGMLAGALLTLWFVRGHLPGQGRGQEKPPIVTQDGIVAPARATEGGILIPLQARGTRIDASFSPDGDRIAVVVANKKEVRIHDARTGAVLTVLPCDGYPVSALYAPWGDIFVALPEGETDSVHHIQGLDPEDGRVKESPLPNEKIGPRFALSPDRRRLAAQATGAVVIWDLIEEREIARYPCRSTRLSRLFAFAPDGRTLAIAEGWIGEQNGYLALWDIDGRTTRELPFPPPPDDRYHKPMHITSLAFSESGARLAGAKEDALVIDGEANLVVTLVIWDVATSKVIARYDEVKVPPGADMRGYRVAYAPGDKWLLSAYSERVSRHDPSTGAVAAHRDLPYGIPGPTDVLAISRGCKRIATVNFSPVEDWVPKIFLGEIARMFDPATERVSE